MVACLAAFGALSMAATLPLRGLHLSAPSPSHLQECERFIREALPKEGVNTLVMEFDYSYQFHSHPEVAEPGSLNKDQVREIAAACHDANVRLIPQINLLGHQSWSDHTEGLLRSHPEFDETPGKYPNNKGIYCRSYCPQAPGLHKVLFDLIDELADACQSDAFHVGMDEVFILADKDCPRCAGHDKAQLFADEVNRLHEHLDSKHLEMWMWGDRFLNGTSTGLGEWEASAIGTEGAATKVPKDIVICDWHYEKPEPTPAYFASLGFRVAACPWRDASVALSQLAFVNQARTQSNSTLGSKFLGVLDTTWCGADEFVDAYNGKAGASKAAVEAADCFKKLFTAVRAESG